MKSPSSLTDKARTGLRRILRHVLADESQLAARTHDYVWRVRGSPVQSINRLFAEQGRQIDRWLAEIGERGRAVGLAAFGARRRGKAVEFSAAVPMARADRLPTHAMISDLLVQHEAMAQKLRSDVAAIAEKYGDTGTASLLTGLLEFHETTAWMLRVLLESPEPARLA